MALRIVVAGEIYLDQIFSGFESWPARGQESYATAFVRELGGGAPHTGAGLARLGWDTVLVGPIGKDAWVRERLAELGVVGRLREHPTEPTGTTVAISMPDERTFFSYPGANVDLAAALADLPPADHLHLAAPCAASTLRTLSQSIRTVSVDAGWHPGWLRDREIWEALSSVDWFFPNEIEASELTGETDVEPVLHRFETLRIRAAVKLGAKGAAALDGGRVVHVPAIHLQPADTTGAGDCFNAGFLDAWLRGESIEESLRGGCVCGGLSTREVGGMNGFPTREELNEWLSKSR